MIIATAYSDGSIPSPLERGQGVCQSPQTKPPENIPER